jgi:exonuclease SbcD
MRILHTSDWHLGQHFMGKSREAEHQAFCRWLVEQVREQAVDAVIIAGDLFDTGAPPSYAREQYNRFIVDLRATGASLVVLAGNHDSVAVLEESKGLLACLGTQVVAAASTDLDAQLLSLPRRDGEPGAALRDSLPAPARPAGQPGRAERPGQATGPATGHPGALPGAVRPRPGAPRNAWPAPADHRQRAPDHGRRASESVREIYVGSLEAFPTSAFPAADYIALGHIHRPQRVGGLEHIRYCGSPIALSFDEARQARKCCWSISTTTACAR